MGTVFLSIILCFSCILIRLAWLLYCANASKRSRAPKITAKRSGTAKTMIVLGSGGHTAEMLEIVKELDINRYVPRFYVLSNTDTQSILKLVDFEVDNETQKEKENFEIIPITRSREVKQSYITAIYSTIISIIDCIPVVYRTKPEIILTNGPGTCVPICLVAFWFKLFFINSKCKIVYVESFCRVKSLSLSGKLLLGISDLFVAQWPEVAALSQKIEYFGRLS